MSWSQTLVCRFGGWVACSTSGIRIGAQALQKVLDRLWEAKMLLNNMLGTLLGPIPNLKRLDLSFKQCMPMTTCSPIMYSPITY
jgi:hypothetical protein